ncbi:MAG: sigma-54-dependent Fis family transcriptional regulator [candidate division Zixibacteria bacterium]|nr:sigma-54-dependent Fis family transcriptional regulator [candidate division Zixibacteria bacterium]
MNDKHIANDFNILIAHRDKQTFHSITGILGTKKYRVYETDSCSGAVKTVREQEIDLVLVDLLSFGEDGLATVQKIKRSFPETGTVVLTDTADNTLVLKCLSEGVLDYIVKPLVKERVLLQLQASLEKLTMKRELTALHQHIAMNYAFDNIVGISKPVVQIKETAVRIAATDITVMITGSPGTGKELLARTIHHHSERRHKPFFALDCSTVPEEILLTELFGQTGGASSEYRPDKPGLFERADGGTVFLEEVSHLPAPVQTRLLRFFQYSEICPVGTDKARKVDVRLIAADSRDLSKMVTAGEFSADLYYKLNVIPINLPPLTARAEDIEILTESFLRKIAFENDRFTLSITRPAVDRLLTHNWPGNIRELENTLKRAAAFCRDNQIDVNDIVFISGDKGVVVDTSAVTKSTLTIKGGTLDKSQRTLIVKALTDNNWNYTKTASELGIGRTTLWRKIKKYNLKKELVEG